MPGMVRSRATSGVARASALELVLHRADTLLEFADLRRDGGQRRAQSGGDGAVLGREERGDPGHDGARPDRDRDAELAKQPADGVEPGELRATPSGWCPPSRSDAGPSWRRCAMASAGSCQCTSSPRGRRRRSRSARRPAAESKGCPPLCRFLAHGRCLSINESR